jgi:hypothetical protein
MMECTFEYFVAMLIADAYLSNLLIAIGMSDSMVGMVSSFASLAFIFQLISMVLVKKITNTKTVPSIIHLVGRLFFVTLYFIPFFDFIPAEYKGITAMVCIFVGYIGNYSVTTIIFKWGNSFVCPAKRATFASTKEMLSLICGMIFTFAMGQAVDYYSRGGNEDAAFIFLGITILVATAADFICLMIMKKEYTKTETVRSEPILRVVKKLSKNRSYVNLVILECMYKSALYVIAGFLGTFKLKELGMTVGLVSIVGIIANLVRVFVSRPLGRFSDKTSYSTGIALGLVFKGVSYLFIIFITPELWWLMIGYQILSNMSLAATNQNFLNSVYSYVDKEHFVQATAIKNCIAGVVGFLTSMVSAAIVGIVQGEYGTGMMSFFGIDIYVQQFLAILSLALTVIAFLFAQLVVRKQKIVGR